MTGLLKDWWRLRGERLCAMRRHDWRDCARPPVPEGIDPMAALAHQMLDHHWLYSVCTRCGQFGRRLR